MKYYFYIQKFPSEGQTYPILDIEQTFDCKYVKMSGIAEDGDVKNIYMEDFAEQSGVDAYIPESIAHKTTVCELTLLFEKSVCKERERTFYEYVNGQLIQWYDTFRNRYVKLILKKEPETVGEKLYGGQQYRQVKYTFENVNGYSSAVAFIDGGTEPPVGYSTTLGGLDNVADSADLIPASDRILMQRGGERIWGTINLSDIKGSQETSLGGLTNVDEKADKVNIADDLILIRKAMSREWTTQPYTPSVGNDVPYEGLVLPLEEISLSLAGNLDTSNFDKDAEYTVVAQVTSQGQLVWFLARQNGVDYVCDDFLAERGYGQAERYIVGEMIYTLDDGYLLPLGHVVSKTIGGTVYSHLFNETDFETALNNALAYAKENGFTTIDTSRFTGNHTLKKRVVLDFPVNLILGNVHLTMEDTIFFDIRSNNVVITGANRQTDKTADNPNATTLILKGVSNLPDEGYHIYSRGNKNCRYYNLVLNGKQTSLGRQCNSTKRPINGTGGIYIEKGNPGTTTAGNTCNATVIENILINGTKAHGIYIDTPILSVIRSVRVSDCAGHGIFINGGTTMMLDSVYVASCSLGGFVLSGVTYCTCLNCVAEVCGLAWWVRSSFNVSIFSPGVEQTKNMGLNPWSGNDTGRYGFNLTTKSESGSTVRINDVPNTSWTFSQGGTLHARDLFIGYAFVITGGRNVEMYSPYVTTIAGGNVSGWDNIKNRIRYFLVLGNARSCKLSSAQCVDASENHKVTTDLRYEIEIAPEVTGLELTYNPYASTFDTHNVAYTSPTPVTSDISLTAPVLNRSESTVISYGNQFFTPIIFNGNVRINGALDVTGRIYTQTGIESDGPVVDNTEDKLTVSFTVTPPYSTVELDADGMVSLGITPYVALGGLPLPSEETPVEITVFFDGVRTAPQNITSNSQRLVFNRAYAVGAHEIFVSANHAGKTAVSDTFSFNVIEKQIKLPTFTSMSAGVAGASSVPLAISFMSDLEITVVGIAYSTTNQNPTTSQNSKTTDVPVPVDGVYTYGIDLPLTSAKERYVRGYAVALDADGSGKTMAYYGPVYHYLDGTLTPLEPIGGG